jgi:hypothetical protein
MDFERPKTVMDKPHDAELTVDELAEALYEGTPHLQNLAEKLARQHGQAGALTFYAWMGQDVQNFYRGIAKQLIDHATHWLPNDGSCCVLDEEERLRLAVLPRVGDEEPPDTRLDLVPRSAKRAASMKPKKPPAGGGYQPRGELDTSNPPPGKSPTS